MQTRIAVLAVTRIAVLAVTALALTSCTGTTGPSASCAPLVRLGDNTYTTGGQVVAAGAVGSNPFAEVTEQKPCIDVNPAEGDNVLRSGESNFLPKGTRLHMVNGFRSDERLAFVDSNGDWRVLIRLAAH